MMQKYLDSYKCPCCGSEEAWENAEEFVYKDFEEAEVSFICDCKCGNNFIIRRVYSLDYEEIQEINN